MKKNVTFKESLSRISVFCLILSVFMFLAVMAFAGDRDGELITNPEISIEENDEELFVFSTDSEEETDIAPANSEEESDTDPVSSDEIEIHNGIPVVYLNIDEEQGTIEDMINSPDHETYCYGTISIDVPEGFHYSDFPDLPCESVEGLSMSIRGRGNSTWTPGDDKNPFKIKLDKKADLFGLGRNKHWVLLANTYDPSLLRDRITAWLGDRLGFEFTPRGVPVDFVMTGQYYGSRYLGSYYFSENVRVDENRLEIDELKESDTELTTISGGYLVQYGIQEDPDSPNVFYTSHDVCWATHTPSFDPEDLALLAAAPKGEEDEPDSEKFLTAPELGSGYISHPQQDYIQNYIQYVEDALYSDSFAGRDGVRYSELMDMDSAAKYWLVNEASRNGDAYSTGSTYIYKKRDIINEDGTVTPEKLYWGPLWDFDFGWTKRITTSGFEALGRWSRAMLYDRDIFVPLVKEYWPETRAALLELARDGGIIDQYYEETKVSAEQDAQIYKDEDFDYKAETDALKTWINDRAVWIDENLDTLDTLIHKVWFVSDDTALSTAFFKDNSYLSVPDEYPGKEGYVFLGWVDEDGAFIDSNRKVTEDLILTAKYVSEEDAIHGEDIAFRQSSDIIKYNPNAHSYQIPYTVLPTNAQYTVVEWSSSDESFATVDENGIVVFQEPTDGPRLVTLTGKLKYGKTRNFTLTVTKDSLTAPESITPASEKILLFAGEQSPFCINCQPEFSKIHLFDYSSENENIVSVNEDGILTAIAPGETQVHVYITSFAGDSDDPVELETEVTAIVLEAPVSISDAGVIGLGDQIYTGSAIKPDVTVTLDGRTLEKDTDYTIEYLNNENAGTATVIITGTGHYTGTKTESFEIIRVEQKITVKAEAYLIAAGKNTVLTVTGAQGTVSYVSSDKKIATVSSVGKVTGKTVGTVKITVTAAETANYNPSDAETVTIKVLPAATTEFKAANTASGIKLTWKKVPDATKYYIERDGETIKTIGSGDTVTYTDKTANVNGTKYVYKIRAYASTGKGPAKSAAKYFVSRPAILSASSTTAGKATVKWTKIAKTTGYQIQHSPSSTFATGKKTVTVEGGSTVSKVIGSLTSGKTYYVRLRAYKQVGSTKHYSAWSAKKSFKVSTKGVETYNQKGNALEPYEKPVTTYYTVVKNENKTVKQYSYEDTKTQTLKITDGFKKGASMKSFLYVGKVNNNNAKNLALVTKYAEVKNPQSVVITPDGRYAYLMYVNKGTAAAELEWKGYVIRYDLKGILANHSTEVKNGKAITLKEEDFKYIKKGPDFVTSHGQSMAYNPVTKELWFIGAPKAIESNLQRINTETLKPDKRINFTLSSTVKMGNNLAFDKDGNAYFYTRTANNNWPTAPVNSIKIYKGTIGENSVSFKLIMQGIQYPPGPIGQSLGYNPANNRLYLVDDGAIMSVPVSKLGKLEPSDVRISIFEHSSTRREFEGLAFTKDGQGYFLTNRQPELMKAPSGF